MRTTTTLQQVPAFTRLTDDQLRQLSAHVHEQRFERGQTIFYQDDPGNQLYIILEGQVRIFRLSPNGQELAVTVFYDGDFFGELALLDGQPRSACAQAMAPTQTLVLEREAFLHTIHTCPPIAAAILEEMATRLRQSSASVESRGSLNATQRVIHQIYAMAARRATRMTDSAAHALVELELTQDDLASMSGTSRETVNRVLSSLREDGLIQVERARIRILNLHQLRDHVLGGAGAIGLRD